MSLLIPDVAEVEMLTRILKNVNNQTLKLYVNDKTPAEGDTAASYTEMSTHSYVAKALDKTLWTVATNAGVTSGTYAQQSWTFTAAASVTVYGYFVVDAITGVIMWAERFTYPQVVTGADTPIKLTPILQQD